MAKAELPMTETSRGRNDTLTDKRKKSYTHKFAERPIKLFENMAKQE